jgi:glutamate-1-semialdehyde 2,1-aminomutase
MKTTIIIQARMGSSRFPGKVMKKINGIPMIGLIVKRLKKSKKCERIVVATSKNKKNKNLVKYLKKNHIPVFLGSEDDVLSRYFKAASKYKSKTIVRITGDCPLADPNIVDHFVSEFEKKNYDYISNFEPWTYPDGLDVEVFSYKLLNDANRFATKHNRRGGGVVFDFLRSHKKKYNVGNIKCSIKNAFKLRLTVDEKEDFDLVSKIYSHFSPNIYFNLTDIMKYYKKYKRNFKINSNIKRNEGFDLPLSQKIWKRALKIIPGGNMLLSKNPDLYLPGKWPTYFSKTAGCHVWGVDKKKYLDICTMGVGTNSLGYSNKIIDNAVIKNIRQGNMSTLNCLEEVTLAEKLIELHPWSDMAKFARTGGEANALAIRIARASTERYRVAFCGYHGWHDWYLSSTLKNKDNLNFHLFPNMNIKGLPPELKNTSFPFKYGDLKGLKKLCNDKSIGIIKMEVCRNTKPNVKYLSQVRKLATQNNIILIFDECTTGFRETLGGIHKKININPDMAIFGKALGNGYPITAVIGKKQIMVNAKRTFASSTFWTDRIGPTAALKTLELMEKKKSWNIIVNKGKYITKKWKELAKKNNLKIKIYGVPSLAKFEIVSKNWSKYKNYITQEMLKKNILATSTIYPCTEHSKKNINLYLKNLNLIFKKLKTCEKGKNIDDLIENPLSFSPFNRLN